ncbi:MAG: hypothetical protein E7256_05225 [Lachnospiraceae bacterium]|nr:hypothetical protein [Lachnospiraceae bacterium]
MSNKSNHPDLSLDDTLDWEYMSDFYEEKNPTPVRSFEEISAKTVAASDSFTISDSLLKKTAEDVKNIRILSEQGRNAADITAALQLEADYVLDILMTLEGYTEDSDLAVARLVLFS